nr:MAG TPA: hypothetical protein [Caudoviricetes sp.]
MVRLSPCWPRPYMSKKSFRFSLATACYRCIL